MEWGLPGPGHVTCDCAVTLSLSLGADLLGCQSQYKRTEGKGNKNETIILCTPSYELTSPTTDRYSSMETFRWIRRTGKIHLILINSEGGKNPSQRDLYWAEIQRREQEKRETRKHPKVILSSIAPLPNPYSSDHPFPQPVYLGVGHCRNHQGGFR